MSSITITEVGSETATEWDAFVEAHPDAKVYHLSGWRDIVGRSFGHRTHYLMARKAGGAVTGVMPLVRIKSRLFGHYMVGLPYFTYGGPLTADDASCNQLMRAAEEIARAQGCTHLETRCQAPLSDGSRLREDKVTMLLPLADTPEGLRKQLTSQRRSQIKRAQAAGPQCLQGAEELLDDFYTVFARNMRDLGTPVYGREFFANILARFPQYARLLVIRVDGKPAGAAFVIGYRELMEVPWVSTIREYNSLNINALLYWEMLQLAQSRGHRVFDFGRSSKDSGTFKFKSQWGAKPQQLYWHYWLPAGGAMPGLTPSSGKFALAVKVWQRLPLAIANRLGPGIVKNLP